jgi:hypothetical protein
MSAAHQRSTTSAKLRSLRFRLTVLLALILASGCAAGPAVDPTTTLTPDAQIAIGAGSLLGRLGFASSEGILDFHDDQYRVFLLGLAPSATRSTGSGTIYDLSRPEDIQGNYHSQYGGRLFTSNTGVQIVFSPPLTLGPESDHLQIEYAGRIFPRAAQTYPLQSDE